MSNAIDWIAIATERAKSGHALYGPSTWPRLVRCPGSLQAAELAGAKSEETEYAIEGSNAHHLAEMTLLDEVNDAFAYVGQTIHREKGDNKYEFVVDDEMAGYVQEYVDWCMELPGDHFIEKRVDISKWTPIPDQFGTSDHGAIFARNMVITDLKFGMGEKVFAEENEQLIGYALGFYDEYGWMYEIDDVTLRISQPRLDHKDTWTITLDELLAHGDRIREVLATTLTDNAMCTPGHKQCVFCPINGKCKPQKVMMDALLMADFDTFDEVTYAKPELLTPDEMAYIIEQREFIRSWLGKIEMRAVDIILRDGEIPNWKVVESQSHRTWMNESEAEAFMIQKRLAKKDIFEAKLISPAKAEKLLPKQARPEVEKFVVRPPGKPVLAPSSDARPDYNPIVSEFDAFDSDDSDDDGLGA